MNLKISFSFFSEGERTKKKKKKKLFFIFEEREIFETTKEFCAKKMKERGKERKRCKRGENLQFQRRDKDGKKSSK